MPDAASAPVPVSPRKARIEGALDRGALALARRATGLTVAGMVLILLATLAIPLLATVAPGPARVLRLGFRIACHQMPDRCLVVVGHPAPVCARCHAIYLGMAISALASLSPRVRRLPFRLLVLAAIPIGVDGVTQMLMLRESTTALRLLTGLLWGLALALFAVPLMRDGFAEAAADLEARQRPWPDPAGARQGVV